jgi:adenylate cyclase
MGGRETTVLFAGVCDATLDAVAPCLDQLREATKAAGGRVIKTIGEDLMALFPSPDAAASAAAAMQKAIEGMPEGTSKPGVRVGFHSGPVLNRDGDVFGDTVNLAARLVAQAKKGEIILSTDTASLLGPMVRSLVRELHAITVKGKSEEVGLAELVWKRDADTTVFAGAPQRGRNSKTVLRLKYRGQELTRRRDTDSIVVGRDLASGLVVEDEMASRQHCTIERRQDIFVLRDHSTNGTYVTVEGDAEMAVRRSEVSLRRHGWIAFGQPRGPGVEVVEFFVDD